MNRRHDHLYSLCRSMDALAGRTPRLERVERSGDAGPGCATRLTSRRGAVATLVLSAEDCTVTTRSGGDHPEAGTSETTDVLRIDLSEGYTWDDVSCRSADQLADLLLKHMYRRTEEAAPEPRERA